FGIRHDDVDFFQIAFVVETDKLAKEPIGESFPPGHAANIEIVEVVGVADGGMAVKNFFGVSAAIVNGLNAIGGENDSVVLFEKFGFETKPVLNGQIAKAGVGDRVSQRDAFHIKIPGLKCARLLITSHKLAFKSARQC